MRLLLHSIACCKNELILTALMTKTQSPSVFIKMCSNISGKQIFTDESQQEYIHEKPKHNLDLKHTIFVH